MLTFPCLSTNNISSPAYVSPNTFPTQTPSYIMTIQEHKLPHQYRPFRVPAPKQRSAQELLSGLLTLGSDAIPKGSFLPSHTRKESKGVVGKYRDSRGRWHGERIDRQVPNMVRNGVVVDVDVEVHEEIAGEYVKVNYGPESPLPPPLPPKSTVYGRQATRAGGSCKAIVRRRDTIKAAQAALARGTSCSSTASTIKAVPVPVPVPTIKSKKQIPPQLDVVSANSKRSGSPATLSSDDGDAPRTPTSGDLLDLPVVQVELAPPTPLNVPPTPLDIPVDWDDLRERWTIGDYYQASLSHHDEVVEEEDAVEEKSVIIPPEVSSPVHAYAGAKHSKEVTELNLSSMTSKDLGQYFLDPQQVTLDGQATSSLLAPPDWAATRSKARGGATSTGAFNEAGSRKSVIVFNPDSLRSTLIIDEFPSPPGSSTSTPTLSSSTTQATTTPIKSTNVPGFKRKMPSFVFPPPALPPPTDALPALPNSNQPNQKPSAMAALKPLVTSGINGSRPSAASSSSAYPPVAKRKGGKRHGRLVSLDEAELVLRTVRFSTTLDPQFDYAKFKQKRAESREASLMSEGSLVLSPVSTIGPNEVNDVQEVIAGESFLSVVSPLSPMNRRWSQSAF